MEIFVYFVLAQNGGEAWVVCDEVTTGEGYGFASEEECAKLVIKMAALYPKNRYTAQRVLVSL